MKRWLIIVLLGMVTWSALAYNLSTSVEYDYNKAWSSYASFNLQSMLPVHPNFELGVNLQAATANVYTVGTVLRPKWSLPVGEMYVDADLRYKAIVRDAQSEMVGALSLGYRMDYIWIQFGCYSRVLEMWKTPETARSWLLEPFNFLYRMELFCRPQSSNWNIHFVFSDYDEYQFERFIQPLFQLGGRYDITQQWRVWTDVQYKPAGMFNMHATTYGVLVKVGFTYMFKEVVQ